MALTEWYGIEWAANDDGRPTREIERGASGARRFPRALLSPGVRVADVEFLQRRQFLFEIFKRLRRQVGAVQV